MIGGERCPAIDQTPKDDALRLLEQARHVTTGSHDTFELMVRPHGVDLTSLFLLCSLFVDTLRPPPRALYRFSRTERLGSGKRYYRDIFALYAIRLHGIFLRLPNRRSTSNPTLKSFWQASTRYERTA